MAATSHHRSTLRDFLASEAVGGAVLLAAAVTALVAANLTATATGYRHLLDLAAGPELAPAMGRMTVHRWIDDGLMTLFFLLVGLEIKREVLDGGLATTAKRRLPVIAAVAGMAVPALTFLAVAGSSRVLQRGWAIPAATDIAFAIGVLALLGSRVPPALKLLLTTVAIVDDMGAVAIIAVAYTQRIHAVPLMLAAAILAAMYALGRRGVSALWPYLLALALLWWAVLASGVHATAAGVAAAALIPIRPSPGTPDDDGSPLHRLEHALQPWVAFAVVPLFGFANAGVAFRGVGASALAEPLVLGIGAGLFLGKQVGIFGAIWGADRLGIARRPARVGWTQLYGMALVAGIGFTMSLFIGGLAFADAATMERVKIGVLTGSLLSGMMGAVVLWVAGRR